MASVTLEGVAKQFGNGIVAVRDLSLAVGDGELVVLVGPSGCGKSTTLRMIAGLESTTRGEIRIGDRRVNDVPPSERDVAMVFQNYALYPHMSVFQNLAFGLKLRKTPRREIERRVREAAAILDIEAVLERRPAELSGGQRQRVAVGRAIVRKPRAFLFDEPLSNLDARLRVQTRKEIARLHRQLGATMIYVTHDQVEAMTLGDRIVLMSEGEAQQIDTPVALYERPLNQFVAGFIGSPGMNFIEGRLLQPDRLVFRSADGTFSVPVEAHAAMLTARSSDDIVLGIRPEHVHVVDPTSPDGTAHVVLAIDVVEPLGGETLVYGRSAGHEIVARCATRRLPEPGAEIGFRFQLDRLHFFDPRSGRAVGTT